MTKPLLRALVLFLLFAEAVALAQVRVDTEAAHRLAGILENTAFRPSAAPR